MCGVFGVLGFESDECLSYFKKLAVVSARRGKDSVGAYAAWPAQTVTPIFKEARQPAQAFNGQPFEKFQETVFKNKGAFSLIGHTRLATNGDWRNFSNNQPAYLGGWVVVHNGIITNDKDLKAQYHQTQHELDTFAMLGLVNSFKDRPTPLSEIAKELLNKIEGANNFIAYNPKNQIILFTSTNGSMYYVKSQDAILVASEAAFLQRIANCNEDDIIQLRGGSYATWEIGRKKFEVFEEQKHSVLVLEPELENQDHKFLVFEPEPFNLTSCSSNRAELAKVLNDHHKNVLELTKNIRRCKRCLLPSSFPGILIDDESCSVCKSYSPISLNGDINMLEKILGDPSKPVLVSLSGGRDSCYSMHILAKEMKRKIVTFTYDWGMVTDLARRNQSRLCGTLDVEHVIVAADIQKKRDNIRKNVSAWLKSPSLGTIPLFMAGDKQYFYYAEKIKMETRCVQTAMGESQLEKTGFKTKFAGAEQKGANANMAYHLSVGNKLKMLSHYGSEFAFNPGYWNTSLFDSFTGFLSYYLLPHKYVNVFDFVRWEEKKVEDTLSLYDWEYSNDCQTSWRIGDGTAPFYNFIYHSVAGFTEFDTLRANQIREGHISIDEAKKLIERDNVPRVESFDWYCKVIGLDPVDVAKKITNIEKIYKV